MAQSQNVKRGISPINVSSLIAFGAVFVSGCTLSRSAAPVEVATKSGEAGEVAASPRTQANRKLIWGLDPSMCRSTTAFNAGIERTRLPPSDYPKNLEKYARLYKFNGICKQGVLSAGLPGEGSINGWCWDYECTCEYHSGGAGTPPVKVQFVVEEPLMAEGAEERFFEQCMRGGEKLPRSSGPNVSADECAGTKACLILGRRAMFEDRPDEALEYFRTGCASDEEDTCRSLILLISSEHFPRTAAHVELFEWATRQSVAPALNRFYGRLLLHGISGESGIEKDVTRGTLVLDSQCGWGEHMRDGVACAILSEEYERGHTAPIDPERANELYKYREKFGTVGH